MCELIVFQKDVSTSLSYPIDYRLHVFSLFDAFDLCGVNWAVCHARVIVDSSTFHGLAGRRSGASTSHRQPPLSCQ